MTVKSSFTLNMDANFWNSILFRLNIQDPLIKSQFFAVFESMLQNMTNHFIQDSKSYTLTIRKDDTIVSKHELTRKEDMYSLIISGLSDEFTSFEIQNY
jgi:hypothetical protein